jgi:hypothetical protein
MNYELLKNVAYVLLTVLCLCHLCGTDPCPVLQETIRATLGPVEVCVRVCMCVGRRVGGREGVCVGGKSGMECDVCVHAYI